jgi:DNA-binding XRE family transcriptional regulator
MGISQCLEQALREQYGGRQKTMAQAWGVKEATLSRWLHRRRIPDSAWYHFLAVSLGTSVEEVHRLCQNERRERMPRPTRRTAVV